MANGVGSAAGRSKRDQMPKQIRLNAFDMNCVRHQSPGLWTHPRDRSDRYNTLDYWVELAKLLERGKFDALFLADVLGVYDVYRGSPHAAIANAVQVPVNDPLLLIPAMAYVTRGALVLMSGWTGVDCELMDRLSRSPVRHKDFLTGDNA